MRAAVTRLINGRLFRPAAATGSDEVIAKLASRQAGVVARRQLLDLGISDGAISRRLGRGSLRALRPGVYAAGHEALASDGRLVAALLAMGSGAVLSHHSPLAARSVEGAVATPIQITVPQRRYAQPGIQLFRGTPPRDEVELVRGLIPATTVPRCLLDLSRTEPAARLRRLVKQCELERLVDPDALAAILGRYPRRQGRRALARIVAGHHLGTGRTRSELEDRFMDFLVERGLPRPERNARVAAGSRRPEVDCVWREARLIVELDGRGTHGTASAFELDRQRDRALVAAGWRVIRVTWLQLERQRDELEADLRAALALTHVHPPPVTEGA